MGAARAATGATTPGVCPELPTRGTALVSTTSGALDKGLPRLALVALVSAPIVATGADTTTLLDGTDTTEVVDTPTLRSGAADATATSLDT